MLHLHWFRSDEEVVDNYEDGDHNEQDVVCYRRNLLLSRIILNVNEWNIEFLFDAWDQLMSELVTMYLRTWMTYVGLYHA